MRVALICKDGAVLLLNVDMEKLIDVSVLGYMGRYYLFRGFEGSDCPAIRDTVAFREIDAPLMIEMQPQPEPERKFFRQRG